VHTKAALKDLQAALASAPAHHQAAIAAALHNEQDQASRFDTTSCTLPIMLHVVTHTVV
jgi:hypothetical protein